MAPKVKGVIFDMDGLMFDTERIWDQFWSPCCRKMSLPDPPPEFYSNGRGLAGEHQLQYIAGYYGDKAEDIFLEAARRIKVDIHDCMVLEDSHNGIRAGHASGAETVMVPDLLPVTDEMRSLYDDCCKDLFEVKAKMEQGVL